MTLQQFMKRKTRSTSEASTVISANLNLKIVKLAVLGVTGVGKSALVKQYINNRFSEEEDLGMIDVYQKQKIINGEPMILELIDTGHDLSDSDTIVRQHVSSADGYMLVFSVSDQDSLNALTTFRTQIRQSQRQNSNLFAEENLQVPMIIVANKIDYTEGNPLSYDIQEKLQCLCLPYIQTSAKTGYGVQEAFDALVEEVEKVKNPQSHHLLLTSKHRKLSYVQSFFRERCIIL